eukprot:symbB.v1.2.008022.t1/scaffold498.1/size458234/14
MTIYEMLMMIPPSAGDNFRGKRLDRAEAKGDLELLKSLPGPWHDATSREEKLRLLKLDQVAQEEGMHTQLYAAYQLRHGDRGLSSNIAVPSVVMHSKSTQKVSENEVPNVFDSANVVKVICRIIVADPEDAERIARIHVRKEPNFGGLMDSIISTTDNDHWRQQRQHLLEAFMPLSSLAQILPVSLARAKECAERLAKFAESGPVDISDFLLHEAQAQLQLALLGVPEEMMEQTNAGIRKTFMFSPDAKIGHLSGAMKDLMKLARDDTSVALPTDGCPVRGPLSRALQTGHFPASTDYGSLVMFFNFANLDTKLMVAILGQDCSLVIQPFSIWCIFVPIFIICLVIYQFDCDCDHHVNVFLVEFGDFYLYFGSHQLIDLFRSRCCSFKIQTT